MPESIIVGEFSQTGEIQINVELVVKRWNHLWLLNEWAADNIWRLIKCVRKDSPMTEYKIAISFKQATELIERLHLESEWCGVFRSGFTWQRKKDAEYLAAWRHSKSMSKQSVEDQGEKL